MRDGLSCSLRLRCVVRMADDDDGSFEVVEDNFILVFVYLCKYLK